MIVTNLTQLSPQVYLYSGDEKPSSIPKSALTLRHVSDEAFGDGSHPTTRLCAGAVDLLCRLQPIQSVLDVGTGTGVLARIARARGAQRIVATDIEKVALQSAKLHVTFDRHSVEIEVSDQLPDHWGPQFNLVIANILEAPLKSLAKNLADALTPKGRLLISGFTPAQIPALRTAFIRQGLKYENESSLEEWALLMFKKDDG